MRCLIVDDESLARDRLRRLLGQLERVDVCGEAANGREALLQAQLLQPDLVFLDIRMPGMDGMEAARHLADLDHPPAVVFTTAYGEHALEAFEAQAVDYLLKPVRRERIERAIKGARRLNRAQLVELEPSGSPSARTHLCVHLRGDLKLVPVQEVRCFQADNKYVTVYTADEELLIEESLKALEEEFGEQFLRVHRNSLVGVAHLIGLEKNGDGRCLVVLDGIAQRPEVSRRHLPKVRRRLKRLSR